MTNEKSLSLLVVGVPGIGKSSLINTLINQDGKFTQVFPELPIAGSGTGDQISQAEIEGINYQIIKLSSLFFDDYLEERTAKIIELVNKAWTNLNQILFVIKLDEERIQWRKSLKIHKLLTQFVFDHQINDFITFCVVSNIDFEDEEICQEDRKKIKLFLSQEIGFEINEKKIIFLDNPPLLKKNFQENLEIRQKSCSILRKHLLNCRECYQPAPIETIKKTERTIWIYSKKKKKPLQNSQKNTQHCAFSEKLVAFSFCCLAIILLLGLFFFLKITKKLSSKRKTLL